VDFQPLPKLLFPKQLLFVHQLRNRIKAEEQITALFLPQITVTDGTHI
jgi:hypothetical protein